MSEIAILENERLNRLIKEGEAAVERFVRGREEIMPMALGLWAARQLYTSNETFGAWLRESPYKGLGPNDRAALINIGEHKDFAEEFLKTTHYTSPQLIWGAIEKMQCLLEHEKEVSSSYHRNTATFSVGNEPEQPKTSSSIVADVSLPETKPEPKYQIRNSQGKLTTNVSRTKLARLIPSADVEILLSAYPSARQNAITRQISDIEKEAGEAAAIRLLKLAVNVIKSGTAPKLKDGAKMDIRMFWPNIPETWIRQYDSQLNPLVIARKESIERLSLMNAVAAEFATSNISGMPLQNEMYSIWQSGKRSPKKLPPPSIEAPPESKIRHNVLFCGKQIWPSTTLTDVTDKDIVTGWHLVHFWCSYLESATPQGPEVIIRQMGHMINDISQASSLQGLLKIMRVCMSAYIEKNHKLDKADMTGMTAPGLKI